MTSLPFILTTLVLWFVLNSQTEAVNTTDISQFFRWSGFLLCAIAMFLVIFPMFTFPKKLPPRHKKKKKFSADVVSDDDIIKEKSNTSEQVNKKVSSMGFGKNVRGKVYLLREWMYAWFFRPVLTKCGPKEVWLSDRGLGSWVWLSAGPKTQTLWLHTSVPHRCLVLDGQIRTAFERKGCKCPFRNLREWPLWGMVWDSKCRVRQWHRVTVEKRDK